MAQNVLKGGYTLSVFNRTKEKAYGLSKNGAVVAKSIKDRSWSGTHIFMGVRWFPSVSWAAFGAASVRFEGQHVPNLDPKFDLKTC